MTNVTIQIQQHTIVKDGTAEYVPPFDINTEKGLQSACNTIAHKLHQLGSLVKPSGMKRYFVVLVDGEETNLKFGDGCPALKVSNKFVKDAGVKSLSLRDFTQDFTLFRIMMPALSAEIRYFLSSYLPEEVRGSAYKADAKRVFGVDVTEKTDLVSFSTQSAAIIEKSTYLVQDLAEVATEENVDNYLARKREENAASRQKALEMKKQAKLLAAGKK